MIFEIYIKKFVFCIFENFSSKKPFCMCKILLKWNNTAIKTVLVQRNVYEPKRHHSSIIFYQIINRSLDIITFLILKVINAFLLKYMNILWGYLCSVWQKKGFLPSFSYLENMSVISTNLNLYLNWKEAYAHNFNLSPKICVGAREKTGKNHIYTWQKCKYPNSLQKYTKDKKN